MTVLNRRAPVLAVAVATTLGSGSAQAQSPSLDVSELPPLPATEDEVSSSATLLAASDAEEDVVVGAAKREQTLGNVASAVTSSPAWTGVNATVYAPNLRGFDLTLGLRNILGTRDLQPAPGDYDRFPAMQPTIVVARIPAEGREVYVKVGYSY